MYSKVDKAQYTKNELSIIDRIKEDVLKEFSNMSIKELDIISSNIYDYSNLMAKGTPVDDISQYFLTKNNKYCDSLTEEDREKLIQTDNEKLEKLSQITKKYVKNFQLKNT